MCLPVEQSYSHSSSLLKCLLWCELLQHNLAAHIHRKSRKTPNPYTIRPAMPSGRPAWWGRGDPLGGNPTVRLSASSIANRDHQEQGRGFPPLGSQTCIQPERLRQRGPGLGSQRGYSQGSVARGNLCAPGCGYLPLLQNPKTPMQVRACF